jgi:hypothetical protein
MRTVGKLITLIVAAIVWTAAEVKPLAGQSAVNFFNNLAGFNLAADSPPILISFDDIPAGTDIAAATFFGTTVDVRNQPTRSAPLMVVRGADTFTPVEFSGVIDPRTNKLFPTSGDNVLSPGGLSLAPGANPALENDDLQVTFNPPVSAIGFDILFQSLDYASYVGITIFDRQGDILFSDPFISTGSEADGGARGGSIFVGFVSRSGNIARIVVDEFDDDNEYPDANIGYDTFRLRVPGVSRPVLNLDSDRYCIGGFWRVEVRNGAANAPVRLLGSTYGQPWEIREWVRTDASGNVSVEGKFAEGTEGSYSLRVEIGGIISNIVSLAISGCTAVDLNGPYLAPSSGLQFDDAVASAMTDPLGDRRGEGQVYELNRGVRVPEGTYTPFSDDLKRPRALSGVDLRGKTFQCDVDLYDPKAWIFDAEFFQIGAGREADPADTNTEEFFVFIYQSGAGFALYMETDWALYREATTYYSAADETRFHVRVDVNTAGTEALLTVIPLNGSKAGTAHTVKPLPLDVRIDNVTSASFFAGFTQNRSNVTSRAKASISNFVITSAH